LFSRVDPFGVFEFVTSRSGDVCGPSAEEHETGEEHGNNAESKKIELVVDEFASAAVTSSV